VVIFVRLYREIASRWPGVRPPTLGSNPILVDTDLRHLPAVAKHPVDIDQSRRIAELWRQLPVLEAARVPHPSIPEFDGISRDEAGR